MKEQYIDNYAFAIIVTMLDYYTDRYIEIAKKCIKRINEKGENITIEDKIFEEIKEKANMIINEISSKIDIPSNSVFYFFPLLKPLDIKKIDFNKKWKTNNVYFERQTVETLNLKYSKNDNIDDEEKIKIEIKKFFDNPHLSPFLGYLGIIHLTEILIRSIFFFTINSNLSFKEKETLLNIFTWMSINSYKNLFEMKNRHWKVGYYFRSLLKFLFFEEPEIIKSYDDNKNIKDIIKETYNNTTKKLKSILSDIIDAKTLFIFPNNISYDKLIKSTKFPYLTALPFFISIGRNFEKHSNTDLKLYVAIATCDYNDEINFNKNIILSYSSF